MAKQQQGNRRTQEVKLRVPIGTHATVTTYAEAHGLNRTEAYLHFIRAGIAAEDNSAPASKSDLAVMAAQLQQAIAQQPLVIQQPPAALESAEQKASRWARMKRAWRGQ